jgi:hypothetical protein
MKKISLEFKKTNLEQLYQRNEIQEKSIQIRVYFLVKFFISFSLLIYNLLNDQYKNNSKLIAIIYTVINFFVSLIIVWRCKSKLGLLTNFLQVAPTPFHADRFSSQQPSSPSIWPATPDPMSTRVTRTTSLASIRTSTHLHFTGYVLHSSAAQPPSSVPWESTPTSSNQHLSTTSSSTAFLPAYGLFISSIPTTL